MPLLDRLRRLLVFALALGGMAWPSTMPAAAQDVKAVKEARFEGVEQSASDAVGRAVAVDFDTAVVGAPYDHFDAESAQAGSVSVYVKADGAWSRVQTIFAEARASDDRYGFSVAVAYYSGRTYLLVGMPGEDKGQGNEGVAMLYVREADASQFSYVGAFSAPDPVAGGAFGSSVALAVHAPSIFELPNLYAVVGAPGNGAAYLFTLRPLFTEWSAATKLTPAGTAIPGLGTAVAMSGSAIVVGSPDEGSGRGAAYVFLPTGTLQSALPANDGAIGDHHGRRVAVSGNTALIAAPDHPVDAVSGAAYVFTRSGTTWSQQARLDASALFESGDFAKDVAISGDFALVGAGADFAPQDRRGLPPKGLPSIVVRDRSVQVFERTGTTWAHRGRFASGDVDEDEEDDAFGNALAIDRSDPAQMIVGATGQDFPVDSQGDAYLFRLAQDYGDAPAPTLAAENGPRHVLRTAGLRLGSALDAEPDAAADPAAAGDDLDGVDDEDGVAFDPLVLGEVSKVSVTASRAGILDAWVDFDASASFDENEKVLDHVALEKGTNRLDVTSLDGVLAGATVARFRVSSTGTSAPTGFARDGEVEDHAVTTYLHSPGVPRFAADAFAANENAGTAAIAVKRVGGSAGALRVRVSSSGGTATSGSDYTGFSKTLSWADGEGVQKVFQVALANDATDERPETVQMRLEILEGSTASTPEKATLTIEDGDPPPTVSFVEHRRQISENGGVAKVTLVLSAPSAKPVEVTFSRAGTATPGDDYTMPASVTFPPGTSEVTMRVRAVWDENYDEVEETVVLALDALQNATPGAIVQVKVRIIPAI